MALRRGFRLLSLAVLAAGLACSSGGTTTTTVEIGPYMANTGSMSSYGEYRFLGATFTGDRGVGKETWRQFVGYDLSVLPAGAYVTAATLWAFQCQVVGEPFAKFGDVVVDHVDFSVQFTFDEGTLRSAAAALSTNAASRNKAALVTSSVRDDLAAGRTMSWFRFRFDPPAESTDETADYVMFRSVGNSGEEGCNMGLPVYLEVQYR